MREMKAIIYKTLHVELDEKKKSFIKAINKKYYIHLESLEQ